MISADELDDELGRSHSEIAVIDLRQDRQDGKAKIPGSRWINLHDGFAQARPPRNLQYDLPTPDEFAAAVSGFGIEPETEIVLADDMLNRWSTRVYWVLKYYGHRGQVRVLDGGIAAYLRSGHATAAEFAAVKVSDYRPPQTRDESIRLTAKQVLAGIEAGSLTLCDVRTPEEFSGELELSGRAGHIPGAINIPWDRCLREDGTFLPDLLLARVLEPYLDDSRQQVTYCQGGVRASLTWFALQVLLRRKAKLYAASWEEWAQNHELPVAL